MTNQSKIFPYLRYLYLLVSKKVQGSWRNFFWPGDIELSEGGSLILGQGNGFMKGYDIDIKKGRVIIGTHNYFSRNLKIACFEKIVIGDDCAFGDSVQIYDHDHNFASKSVKFRNQGYTAKPVHIGDNVWVGARSVILKGVEIGDNCVIGAGAIVTKSIPANSIAVGVPAKVIKTRN